MDGAARKSSVWCAFLLLLIADVGQAAVHHHKKRRHHSLRRSALLGQTTRLRSKSATASAGAEDEDVGTEVSALEANPQLAVVAPPPNLDPTADGQPLDTRLGYFFAASMSEDIPVAPLANMTDLTISLGCPALLTWPSTVEVSAPDLCDSASKGHWGGESPLVEWSTSCTVFSRNLAPVAEYRIPSGPLFGTSQTATTLLGTTVILRDCLGKVRYTIDEKVYHQTGSVDADSCDKYGSCDGTIWLQFFIRDQLDRVIAQTPYLHLFQDQFIIQSPGGGEIATATRGMWNPSTEDCGPRSWTLVYNDGAEGVWADATQRWPVAELVSIITIRDGYRRPSGLTRPSTCEIVKMVSYLFLALLAIFLLFFGGLIFRHFFLNRLRILAVKIEARVCPKRMKRPSRYEG